MIRVNGLELMNSRWHRSEEALAQAASAAIAHRRPRILLGGLGIGYTLAALIGAFPDRAALVVAEKSGDVVRWYRAFFRAKVLIRALDDRDVEFRHEDVRDTLDWARERFDVIVLDVDNGPEPVSGDANGDLYTARGIRRVRDRLAEGGAFVLWSGFRSDAFHVSAERGGFDVACLPVRVGLREHEHFIYVCKR